MKHKSGSIKVRSGPLSSELLASVGHAHDLYCILKLQPGYWTLLVSKSNHQRTCTSVCLIAGPGHCRCCGCQAHKSKIAPPFLQLVSSMQQC